MRAILIDSVDRQIREIEIQGADDISDLLGGGAIDIAVAFPNGDKIYVDDMGFLHDKPIRLWGVHEYGHQLYPGDGVLVGEGPEGDLVDCAMDAGSLGEFVYWPQPMARPGTTSSALMIDPPYGNRHGP